MGTPRSKNELFENARARWPEQFLILGDQPATPAILTRPPTFETYEAIEQALPPEDEWASLAAWAFLQSLSELVQSNWEAGVGVVRSNDVSFLLFDRNMTSNLSDSSWTQEREIYSRLPLSRPH
ncbi:hypothetical protein G5B46_07345 [Caulobacter sp. 602-2]|uniref:Uncharacterized protein n=1 Tax=Caulobacter sp. 602-2 TaxID=2710887 RepID=A0A6G4QUT4_9CAUL|nr:hypothetical protein [Caulobacter sp. 602-2]NGM49416.1 hypothetical protein [Caulobacter sp. 602-2]